MQITASAAISTICARMSCVIRSGMNCVRLFPTRRSRFPLNNPPTHDRVNPGETVTWVQARSTPYWWRLMKKSNQLKMPAPLFSQKGSRRNSLRSAAVATSWLRALLRVPLEIKLLGANLVILGLAVLVLFAPARLQVGHLTDLYVVVTALIIGATVNFGLVRLALRPINDLQRVARGVSEGRLAERVPASIVADRELTQLSTTINEMLDNLEVG